VEPGLAVGLLQLVQLNPPGGLHKYDDAPLAVSDTEPPLHTKAVGGTTEIVGVGFTVMVNVELSTQPLPDVPTRVYVVVEVGLAVTVVPVVALNPVAGLHV